MRNLNPDTGKERPTLSIRCLEELEILDHSFISKINTSNRNYGMVPPNATIRYEYVKCGKSNCIKCSEKDYHGGYYYAYFRDKQNHGKLKKKYIGFFDPRSPYVRGFGAHHVKN